MYLVVGATGLLGSEVCRQMREKGLPVAALVRYSSNGARVDALRAIGVNLILGDLKDPQSLLDACKGVSGIVSTATAVNRRGHGDTIDAVDRDGQRLLVDSARALRVPHLVYVSANAAGARDNPLISAKQAVEAHLSKSSISYTILRPAAFMETWISPAHGFDAQRARVQVYGSGMTKVPWISMRDVAAAAISSLQFELARNRVFTLDGPEALSQLDIVGIFEELTGRKFLVESVPVEPLRNQYAAATDPNQKSLIAMLLQVAEGAPRSPLQSFDRFPIRLTTVREYAQRVCPALAHA